MRGKLLFVTGAALGYVLGARAGRKRYEQIKSAASKVWESPGIQKQVDAVEDFVATSLGEIPELVYEGTKKLVVQAVAKKQAVAPKSSATKRKSAAAPKKAVAADQKPAARTKQAAPSPTVTESGDGAAGS